jgi:glycosyltransferase involved in cell wall biosynthesis
MKNITVILPVHTIDGDYNEMLNKAIESAEEFHNDIKISIVCPENVKKKLKKLSDKLEIDFVINKGNTDFCSQINLGIEKCETDWFSILEIDDEYKPIWLKSLNEYMKIYPDVDVFLPIVKDINPEGKFVSFTNESAWAYGFTEMQGFIDNEVLLEFQNYQISGGVYRTQKIKDVGMLKENIKLTFGYEFFLRLTHNGLRVMTVPRVGYQHVNLREDSLFWLYKNNEENKMTEKEVKFWLDTAKKEFFFKNKREVNYVE